MANIVIFSLGAKKMDVWLSLFFSLMLTSLVSFTIPMVLFFSLLGSLSLISHVDFITVWANSVYENIWMFLTIFGEGSGWIGICTLAVVAAIAGLIFELLSFYRHRILMNRDVLPSWQGQKTAELISKILYKSNNQ